MPSLVPGEPLRVLLVSPDTGLYEAIGAALVASAGEHRYFRVAEPGLALVRSQDLAPHIILIDGNLVGVPELVEELAKGVAGAAIVVLVPESEAGVLLARDALLAGARAFLTLPVQAAGLAAALRQVLSRRLAASATEITTPPIGRVIVFCGPKGGTGRTTLAINTAVSLCRHDQRVVLVDADYAAPAVDVALNLRGQRDIRDLIPKLSQLDADLIASVLASHSSGIKVLLAPPPDSGQPPPTLPQVQQVIAWLRRMFPWVLVDLGLPLNEAAYAFLDMADRVIVSVLPEMVGVRNARLMLAQFAQRGYPPEKVWPLLNRKGLEGGLMISAVEAALGRPVRFAVPNDQILATETINLGVPMVTGYPRRQVSLAYMALAAALIADRAAATAPAGAAATTRKAAAVPLLARLRGFLADRYRRPLQTSAAILIALVLLFSLITPWLLQRFSTEQPAPPLVAAVSPVPTATTAGSVPAQASLSTLTASSMAGVIASSTETATATPAPTATVTPEPTATLAATSSPTPEPSATPVATSSPTPEPSATPVATSSPTPEPSATPTAIETPTETPTLEPTVTPTATPTEVPTATATPRPTPTRPPAPLRPTATPAPAVSQPALVSPAPNVTAAGVVVFRWQPTGPLPTGAAYEVVWWNDGEDPAVARGIAPPTTNIELAANLDALYAAGQLKTSLLRWTVLIVRPNPYVRLIRPDPVASSVLFYQAPAPPPPPPTPLPPRP